INSLPKREAMRTQEEIGKLNKILGGVKGMTRLPDAIFIVDTRKERLAIQEALRLEIPVIALLDTNSDPDEVQYPIPANDDAIRAVRLLCSKIADAAIEGRRQLEAQQKDGEPGEGEEAEAPIQEDFSSSETSVPADNAEYETSNAAVPELVAEEA
ncbi:MAG TPA: 30S ribosomal protein S2, partial [Ktedonobacteraceae bacterium]|nr:30S ribosomal protein S2 [Ktedonobacteraceae bacterium]